jgi:Protein of unknown function (DUF3105)
VPNRRPGAKAARLDARAQALQEKSAHIKRLRSLVVGAGAVAVLGLAAGGVAVFLLARPAPSSTFHVDGVSDRAVGDQLPKEKGVHISPPQKGHWATDPPTSGEHYSLFGTAPAPWGYHDETLPPEDWVHNLEHGGIAILYNCPSGCSGDQAAIRHFVDGAPAEDKTNEVKLIATPFAVPGHPFALVAWGWRLYLDAWDPKLAKRFYEAHADQAPELVP